AWLQGLRSDEVAVNVLANTRLQGQAAEGNAVLHVYRIFLDIGVIAEIEIAAAVREVIGREPVSPALGDVKRIRDAEREILCQEGVLDLDTGLYIVVAIGIRDIRLDPGVGEAAALGCGGGLIGKGIGARPIMHLILPDIRA